MRRGEARSAAESATTFIVTFLDSAGGFAIAFGVRLPQDMVILSAIFWLVAVVQVASASSVS